MTYIKKPAGTAWYIVAGAVCAALIAPSARADTQYWIDSEVWAAYQLRQRHRIDQTRSIRDHRRWTQLLVCEMPDNQMCRLHDLPA